MLFDLSAALCKQTTPCLTELVRVTENSVERFDLDPPVDAATEIEFFAGKLLGEGRADLDQRWTPVNKKSGSLFSFHFRRDYSSSN